MLLTTAPNTHGFFILDDQALPIGPEPHLLTPSAEFHGRRIVEDRPMPK